MILPDVNVLVGAFRRDSAHHRLCRSWLDNVVRNEAPFGISPLALSAVVRITTNPRAFKVASAASEALGFCDDLLEQPHCARICPAEQHWRIFSRLVNEAGARGNIVTDAWYAALAIEHGCTWITLNRDFARFAGLDWRAPA